MLLCVRVFCSFVKMFFSLDPTSTVIMSWNRFDSHNFMTSDWVIRFSMVNHSISIVYGKNLIWALHTFQSKWCEQKQANRPTVRAATNQTNGWFRCLKIFDCFRSVAVPNWKKLYIWSLHICCKLKPKMRQKKKQRWYIIAVSVIHQMKSPNRSTQFHCIELESERANKRKQKKKSESTNCFFLFPLSFL